MTKGIGNHAYKHGLFAGYVDYRYGGQSKPVTLAGQTQPVGTKREKREHLISSVMDILRDWRMSPFEHQGACVAGLRAGMCLEGHSWPRADLDAREIVAEGLRRIGATYPTYDQGQRQYTIADEDCNWCGRPIDETDRMGNRKARFCSETCARSALQHRDFETNWKDSAVGRSAFSIIHRDSKPACTCEHCGVVFRPFSFWRSEQRYCSQECKVAAQTIIPEQPCATCGRMFRPQVRGRSYCSYQCAMERPIEDRACACCGRTFRPKSEQAMFCSKACLNRSARQRRAAANGREYLRAGTILRKSCMFCDADFETVSPRAQYCDARCQEMHARIKRGDRIPRVLSPKIFDYMIRLAA